jgi:ligand-binding sensor domain-containing protein/DNA-binding CsgD family transcriptional regulator
MLCRIFILFALTIAYTARCQNTIGLPDIVNFDKHVYNAGAANRNIAQDINGIMYFANNEGLLSFDGTYWKLYPLPNKTIVRSIAIGKDRKIYIGGQDEIGYFSPDKHGNLLYSSLKALLPKNDRSFTDIWNVVSFENDIFFQCNNKVFQFSGRNITVFNAASAWTFIGTFNNELYGQDAVGGILLFKKGVWQALPIKNQLPSGTSITSITPFGKDSALITTSRNGLFLYTDNSISAFDLPGNSSEHNFSSSLQIDKETYALSSNIDGCLIINKKGEIIQSFTGKTGLLNSRVLSIFQDKNRNLWLGLENGIDLIAYSNAIRHINPSELNEGSGYASVIYKNQLYFGLSNGLFSLPLTQSDDLSYLKGHFQPVAQTEGQVWGLNVIDNRLLLGSIEGMFEISNNKASPVITTTGFWNFQPLQTANHSLIVAGNYYGLSLLQPKNNNISLKETILNFKESSRYLAIDNNKTIWVSHPYRGIYKIDSNSTGNYKVKLYTDVNGLPSALDNHVFKVKNKILIATLKGIYEYNQKNDSFVPSPYFSAIFKQTAVRYLKEDPSGNIWFIQEKSLGIVNFSKGKPQVIYLPELNRKMVSGFEHIFPVDDQNILLGAEKGFYHINFEKYRKNNHQIDVLIRHVQASGKRDSILFGGYFADVNDRTQQLENQIPSLNHQWNSFHFEFSSPHFENQTNIEYSYQLQGFDKTWSEWSKKTEKEYTKLPAGKYIFHVKARNNLGNESAVGSYTLEVMPPWYLTYWAYFCYFLIITYAFYLLYKRQQNRLIQQQIKHKEEQEHLQYLHQLELDKTEKEIIKLKNDKLEAEIEYKNSELASIAMHLAQKGEILIKIKDELQRLNKNPKHEEPLNDLKKVIRILSEEERINADWDHFAVHFDKVHNDFLIVLKEKFPDLKPHELRLCAFLRMNLSSKEVAGLMNISVRGVEISRYRVRKKLQIPTEVNLAEFLLSIDKQKEKTTI